MTEDNCPRVSSAESMASTESATTKQRKKRKWDQPAESLVSAGVAVPGILPMGNMGSLVGIGLPGVPPVSGALLMNPLTACSTTVPQVFQVPSIQPHTAAVVQKITQAKIQDELIAREIVINDAESSIRYKLTKRQTQEEIQKGTGAVVITRGKYRPPNAPPDGEKPLYLHISAGAHLKDTVERIKAVDLAAAMVEEMLKQGSVNNGVKVTQALSTCVFLGFEADPSLNVAARIHGPNDQYVNHIMNETGATVLLRGRDSGNSGSAQGEDEGQQPLHLFLSSNNPISLENAKLLAENLLDTISKECGLSRISSSKVYGAVPPPQQLLAGVESSGNELKANISSAAGSTSSTVGSIPVPPAPPVTLPGFTAIIPQVMVSQSVGLLNSGSSQQNMACSPRPSLTGGTSYNGYGGIYPQATPLQQVALALRQSPSPVTSTVAPVTTIASTVSKSNMSSPSEREKRPNQKRKFQELPVASKGPAQPHQGFTITEAHWIGACCLNALTGLIQDSVLLVGFFPPKNSLQGSEFVKPSEPIPDLGMRSISTMPAPKKLVQPSSNGMPPLPPRTMPLPPPPPKFNSSAPVHKVHERNNIPTKTKSETVPDTLIKLMEYGEEDDDPDEPEEPFKSNSNAVAAPKPFWAV